MKAVLFVAVALALCVNVYAVMTEEQLEDQGLLLEASKSGWNNAAFKAQMEAVQRARALKAGSGINPGRSGPYKRFPLPVPVKKAPADPEASSDAPTPAPRRGGWGGRLVRPQPVRDSVHPAPIQKVGSAEAAPAEQTPAPRRGGWGGRLVRPQPAGTGNSIRPVADQIAPAKAGRKRSFHAGASLEGSAGSVQVSGSASVVVPPPPHVVHKINWARRMNKLAPPVPTLSPEQIQEAKKEIKAEANSPDFIAAAKAELAKEEKDKKEEEKKEMAFEKKEAKLEVTYNKELEQVQQQIKSYEKKELAKIQQEEKREAAIAEELVTAKPLKIRRKHNPFVTPKPVVDEAAFQKAEAKAEKDVKKYEQAEAASIKQEMKREAAIAKELNNAPDVQVAPAHNPFAAPAADEEEDDE